MNNVWLREQREISSKNLISLEVFLVYAPISVISAALSVANQLSSENIAEAIYLGVNITALTGAFILIVNQIVMRWGNRIVGTKREVLYISILAAAGVTRGLLLHFSYQFTSFEVPTDLFIRIFSSTFNLMFWIYLVQRVFEDTKRFNNMYRMIIRTAIINLARERKEKEITDVGQFISGELEEIKEIINRSIDTSTQNALRQVDLIHAAQTVRGVIENKIRPLSHRLWVQSNTEAPKMQLKQAIFSGLQNLGVPALPISITVAFSSAVNLTTNFGFVKGLPSSALVFAILMTYFTLVKRIKINKHSGNIFAGLTILIIPGLLLSGVFYLINRFILETDLGPQNLVFVPTCFAIGACLSVYEINKTDRKNVIETLERELSNKIDTNRLKESQAAEKIASYLHNTLQSELLALSYQLENSAKNLDADESRSILERLASRINRSINDDFENFQEDPLDRLRKIQSAWKGIATVEISIPDTLLMSPNRNFVLVQIIEESIANAVRHQSASVINIEARAIGQNSLKLTISSDGESVPSGNSGVGTEWLDRFAPGKWRREILKNKTVLEIEL